VGRFHDVQAFVREANRVTSLDTLRERLMCMVETLGFEYFALGHHVNVVSGDLVQIGNYPESWTCLLLERNYISDDPILRACQTTVAGFRWSEVSTLITLTPRHKEILSNAASAGLGDGFTVPVHIPGECGGSCSFARKLGRTLIEASLPAAQYVGCFSFEAARRLARKQASDKTKREFPNPPRLTTRQLDCVVLVARGKSDWEAGKVLGISPETVHQHIEFAKHKYDVATRMQLVIRTLFDNQVGFRDILGH
jgi:LuxR family quorum-sensing system transcriptional regulator CciR